MFIRHYLFIFALAIITCDAIKCFHCDYANCTSLTLITNTKCKSCWASQRLTDPSPWEMGCSTQEHEFCRKYSDQEYRCHCRGDGCNKNVGKYISDDSYVKMQGNALVCYECDDNDPRKVNCNNPKIITKHECKSCYAEQVKGNGLPYEMGCSTKDHRFCTQYTEEDYKCYCQEDGCNTNVTNYFSDKNYKMVLDISNCNRGYKGNNCDTCRDGYLKNGDLCCKYGFFNDGGTCTYCNCSAEGIMVLPVCTQDGKCYCKPCYSGDKCDKYEERVIQIGNLNQGAYIQVTFYCFGPCVWEILEVGFKEGGNIDIEGVDQDFQVDKNGIVGSKTLICSGRKSKDNPEVCHKYVEPGNEVYFLLTATSASKGVEFRYKSPNLRIVGHKRLYAN